MLAKYGSWHATDDVAGGARWHDTAVRPDAVLLRASCLNLGNAALHSDSLHNYRAMQNKDVVRVSVTLKAM
jgi:hypothetical protein